MLGCQPTIVTMFLDFERIPSDSEVWPDLKMIMGDHFLPTEVLPCPGPHDTCLLTLCYEYSHCYVSDVHSSNPQLGYV